MFQATSLQCEPNISTLRLFGFVPMPYGIQFYMSPFMFIKMMHFVTDKAFTTRFIFRSAEQPKQTHCTCMHLLLTKKYTGCVFISCMVITKTYFKSPTKHFPEHIFDLRKNKR